MLAGENVGGFVSNARDVQAPSGPVGTIAELQGDLSRYQIYVCCAGLELIDHVEGCHVVCANAQEDFILLPDALPNSNRHELRQAFCCPLCRTVSDLHMKNLTVVSCQWAGEPRFCFVLHKENAAEPPWRCV